MLIVLASMGMFSAGRGTASPAALFFWPAIFLSLRWNFCEYGFFKTGGLAWGWMVCGMVFVVMGGFPLYLMARKVSGRELLEAAGIDRSTLRPQLVGVGVGIPLGVVFFSVVSWRAARFGAGLLDVQAGPSGPGFQERVREL